MKTLKIVYLIAGGVFFLLSICCILINIQWVYNSPNMTIYIPNIIFVVTTSIIFFILSIFMITIAFISCSRAEFENHLRKY